MVMVVITHGTVKVIPWAGAAVTDRRDPGEMVSYVSQRPC